MSGSGYYDFPDSAKPRVEIGEILICWFTTGLLLAFFAFLLKIGVDYSRGAFVVFYFVAPVGLLAVRKATKVALAAAVSRGVIGRRDIVLIGDFHEIAALEPRDLLVFFGTSEVSRFTLSSEDDPAKRDSTDVSVINSAANFVRRNNCREVLLAMPWEDAPRLEFIREHVKTLPVAVRLLPDMRVRTLIELCVVGASARPGHRNSTCAAQCGGALRQARDGHRHREPGAGVLPADHGAHGDRHQA